MALLTRSPRVRSPHPTSTTTTLLAEGFTDAAFYGQSRYDNYCRVGCSRASSVGSKTSKDLQGSKDLLSLSHCSFSPLPTHESVDEEDDSSEEDQPPIRKISQAIPNLHRDSLLDTMLHATRFANGGTEMQETQEAKPLGKPPNSFLGKAKWYYDKYQCRKFAPLLLLFVYSLLGAAMFYYVEHDNEVDLRVEEAYQLDKLRNQTYRLIGRIIHNHTRTHEQKINNARSVLVWYERSLKRVKLLEGIKWDYWGAMFYVGSLFTTIGYGNIFPRTTLGRILSVPYSIIGIPLVLAILSQMGRALTNVVSDWWQRYRKHVKEVGKKAKRKIRRKKVVKPTEPPPIEDMIDQLAAMESGLAPSDMPDDVYMGDVPDEEEFESRTIPVWLALFMCVGWICACAGLFCIWERRWSFFTSLYFFFISLSTIGLGDVVPDHPHMLILMFWLVIIGLSIVSMLLSVIQIKMEEWLYTLMIKMQKEYARALAEGDPLEKARLMERAMEHEPWLMRQLMPGIMTEAQAEKVEQRAEAFERCAHETNTKHIQTESWGTGMGVQAEQQVQSMACDPLSLSIMSQIEEVPSEVEEEEEEEKWTKEQWYDAMGAEREKEQEELRRKEQREKCDGETQWSSQMYTASLARESKMAEKSSKAAPPKTDEGDGDSISDASSIPLDSVSMARKGAVAADSTNNDTLNFPKFSFSFDADVEDPIVYRHHTETQTDLAQFQIEEIALRLYALQKDKESPAPEGPAHQEMSTQCRSDEEGELVSRLIDLSLPQSKRALVDRACSVQSLGSARSRPSLHSMACGSNDVSSRSDLFSTRSAGCQMSPQKHSVSIQHKVSAKDKDCWAKTSLTSIGCGSAAIDDTRSAMTSPHVLSSASAGCQMSPSLPLQRSDAGVQHQVPLADSSIQHRPSMSSIGCGSVSVDLIDGWNGCETVDRREMSSQMSPLQQRAAGVQVGRETSHAGTSPSPESSTSHAIQSNRVDTTAIEMAVQTGESVRNEMATGDSRPPSPEAIPREMTESSTQYTPPPTDPMTAVPSTSSFIDPRPPFRQTASIASLYGSFEDKEKEEEKERQEVIIQTDDSYLKIARRLDEYRNNNKSQFLPVMAASPRHSRSTTPTNLPNGPSERSGFFLDPFRKRSRTRKHSKAQREEDSDFLQVPERSRSISPSPHRKSTLERKASLPTGIPRGRVRDYIDKHERGIPNPATDNRPPVVIVREGEATG